MRKTKKCKHCKKEFELVRPLQTHCSIDCAIEHARELKQKNLRKQYKEAKEHAKTRQDWIQTTQQATNAYIRERDKDKPCVSCGKYFEVKDAGHFQNKSTHPELRFIEENIHGQCRKCNSFLHGNLLEYRKELINRIGIEKVEELEKSNKPAKYTKEDLQNITNSYRIKLNELRKNSNG